MKPDYTASIKWRCTECEDVFLLSFKERYYDGRDCACVEGRKAIPGKTSLKALHPMLAAEFSPNNPSDSDHVLPTYHTPMLWDCHKCGMTWSSSVSDRVEEITDCPYCNNRKAIPGKTSFKAVYSELLEEWAESSNLLVNPDNITSKNNKKVIWYCISCGHPFLMSVKQRLYLQTRNKNPCNYCRGYRRPIKHFI